MMTDGINLTEIGAAFAAASVASASIGTFIWKLLKPKVDKMFEVRDRKISDLGKLIALQDAQIAALKLVDDGQTDAINVNGNAVNKLEAKYDVLFSSFKQYKVDDEKAARALREELADRIRDVGNKLYAHVAQPIKDIERLKGLAGIKPNGN